MRRGTCLLVLVLAAPAGLARAADEPDDEARQLLLDDVRFAERLAHFRFFDLALEALGQVKARELDAQARGTVLAVEADILAKQSDDEADPEARLLTQTRAIEMLADWARPGTPFVDHADRPSALENLWRLLDERGKLRTGQAVAAGDAERAGTLRKLAAADFRAASEVLVTLQREYESRAQDLESGERLDEAANLRDRAALCIYDRGVVLLDWADAETDPTAQLEQASDTLTDYQWELDEEVITQYYALHFQGVATRRLGRLAEAGELQAEVVERGQWFWDNRRVDPQTGVRNPGQAGFVSELMDRGWGELARVKLESGDPEGALAAIDALLKAHADGQEPFTRAGVRVLLDLSGLLAQAGHGSRASELVALASDAAPPGSREREEAVARLAELVSGGRGDEPASVLMAAAEGQYADRRFGDAAFTWMRALAALRDDADRARFEFDAWLGIANALKEQQRHLESALACEQALEAALRHGRGEDAQKAAAFGMYNAWDRRLKETADAFDKTLRDAASERLIGMGVGEDLQFLRAREAFDEALRARPQEPARYLAALEEFRLVPEPSPSSERSRIYAARALAGAGRPEEALAAFDAFLARAPEATSPAAKARHEVALGECLYYRADLLLSAAPPRPADALATLDGFEARVPGQPGLIESVKYQRVVAFALLGDIERGTAAWEDLKAFAAEGKYLAPAAFRMADMLLRASTAARDAGDAALAGERLERAADFMWLHCERTGFPSFANLVNSGIWYAQTGRHELALRSFEKAVERFGSDASLADEPLDGARLGLATALDELHEFARARGVWLELLASKPRDPQVMRGAARCFGGWLEPSPDGATVTELPGSGHYAEAVKLWSDLHQAASARKYQRDWWESKLGAVYACYRDGSRDPGQFVQARRVLDNVRVMTPDYDADTVGNLPAEQRYAPLFKPLFEYLEQTVPQR